MEKVKSVYIYKGFPLSQWREKLGLTQLELAAIINKATGGGLSDVVISSWENGKFKPSKIYAFQLEKALESLSDSKLEEEVKE